MDFNPKKTLYRKLGAVVLLIALTLALLTGCDKSSPAVSADPNIGIWKATTVEMFGDEYDANEIFDGGFELEFMAGDKCEFRADGKKDTYKWMSQGNTLTVSSDGTDIISATIEDGVMVIGDFMETGMKIALKKEGATTDKPDASAEATLAHTGSSESEFESEPESESETEAQALWNGTWYGYIWVTEGFGSFETEEVFLNDAYLTIDINETGEGTLEIILDGDDENMVEGVIQADENHFEVMEGYLWDTPLNLYEWWIALSPVSEGKLFVVGDTYTDPEGVEDGFEYMFCFRPYGEPWDQEDREGDIVPPGYGELYRDDWTLDGYAGDVDSGTAEQGADAAPHFTSANLKSIYEELSNAYDDFSLKDLSYEEVRDEYFDGVDGELDYEEGVLAIYKWFATDNGEAYVQVSFQDYIGDGDKTAGGVGSYLP